MFRILYAEKRLHGRTIHRNVDVGRLLQPWMLLLRRMLLRPVTLLLLLLLQIMWCFISIIGAAMAQPHNPHQANPKLVVALQQFSWTEAALGDTISRRNAAARGRLDKEPMFCFETAIKLFFWSCLMYEDYEGVS